MKPELILIANSTEARLFTRHSENDPLLPLATLEQPEGRLKSTELGDDRLGHGSNDSRPGGVSFTPRVAPKRKKHLQFARLLAQRIDEAMAGGACGRVTLFASCPFLGELKGELSPAAKKALHAAIDLDLTSFGLSELEQRIDQELAPTLRPAP